MTDQSSSPDEALQPVSADTIVVGHDGSAAAHHALRTALGFADQLRAPVAVVRAWSFATAPRPQDWPFGYVPSSDQLHEAVHRALVRDVHRLVERLPHVNITYRAVHGAPAPCLVAISVSARMLVVGSRGLGDVAQLMLGSISDEVIKKANCPVLVAKQPES